MFKDHRKPKLSDKDKLLSNDVEITLYGLMLLLVAVIGLLNKGWIGQFLTYISVYLFGTFYFVVFLLMIFFGGYLILKKKLFKTKIGIKFLGVILIVIAVAIAASLQNESLTLNNVFSLFSQQMAIVSSSPFHIDSFVQVSASGGGIIGFLLCAILNSTITVLGTKVIVIIFLLVGLILLFKDLFIMFFKSLNRFIKAQKEKKKAKNSIKTVENSERNISQNVAQETSVIENKTVVNNTKVEEKTPIEPTNKELNTSNPYFEEKIEENKKEEVQNKLDTTKMPILKDFFAEDIEEENEAKQENESKPVLSSFDDNHSSKVIPTPQEPFIEEKEESIKIDDSVQIKDEPVDLNPIQKEEVKASPVLERKEITPEFRSPIEPTQENVEQKPVESMSIIAHKEIKKDLPYVYPSLSLLSEHNSGNTLIQNSNVAEERSQKINELFRELKIGASVVSYTIGPSVTRFDVKMNPGVRVNSLASIQNEVAIKLGGNKTVRLEMVVEGKDTSGIEVGNEVVSTVSFKDCMTDMSSSLKDKLQFPLGKDICGNVIKVSIDELPHLLVAGATGSGKSVFIHSIIMSLIMRTKPNELKLMLIDPKKVEFAKYRDMPHLLCPVISDLSEVKVALQKLVDEMEERYTLFMEKGEGSSKYSEYVEVAKEHNYDIPPYIVMIIDEFADLMSTHGKEIEPLIQRLAQKARAAGIYMIIATQRPSVNVITGDIKANIPSRVALSVSSSIDSRTILDESGAESLLGHGDMLVRVPSHKSVMRIQSSYIDNHEIFRVVDYLKRQCAPSYDPKFLELKEKVASSGFVTMTGIRRELDPLHEQCKQYVIESGVASTTKLQKMFGIGFSRADYILDCLEHEGIIKKVAGGRRIVINQGNNGNNNSEE